MGTRGLGGRTWLRASSDAPGNLSTPCPFPKGEVRLSSGTWSPGRTHNFTQSVSRVGSCPSACPLLTPTQLTEDPHQHPHPHAASLRRRVQGPTYLLGPPRAGRSRYTDMESQHPLRKVRPRQKGGPRQAGVGPYREGQSRGEGQRVLWAGPGQRQSLGGSLKWCQSRGEPRSKVGVLQ